MRFDDERYLRRAGYFDDFRFARGAPFKPLALASLSAIATACF